MNARLGFFDVDCQEMNATRDGLALRPRVQPLAEAIARLHAAAEAIGAPLVFTTCCSGRMPQPGDLPGTLFIPLDAADRAWEHRVTAHRRFYLQKRTYGDPKVNGERRAFDMFQDNGNAERLVKAFAVDEWIVFGNAFDVCVDCCARGLLNAGQRVCLLTDVAALSVRGTRESLRAMVEHLSQRGARVSTMNELLSLIDA
ncbi:MAG: isochorismatase family protein [Phycisphaerae bacterium]|nr:isochorismatase family protein [Phycisphaerae bacterium]